MLDLSLTKPMEPVKLPNGRVLEARPLDADGWELWREVRKTGDNAKAVELVQRILPDATLDDLESLGEETTAALVLYVQGKVSSALALLGNSPGTGTASTSPPSSPPPTPSTS